MDIACTLSPAARADRIAGLPAPLSSRPVLTYAVEDLPRVRELIAAEAECCPFLTFELQLHVSGPPEAAPIIAELQNGASSSG